MREIKFRGKDEMFKHKHYRLTNLNQGQQYRFKFENGYGASVVRDRGSFGSEIGLWELAVLWNNSLCYDTEIADDVIGFLTPEEVNELLDKIEQLPKPVAK